MNAKGRGKGRVSWQGPKYTVSFHDGTKTHPDGSPFFDLRIFHDKKKRDRFCRELAAQNYTERGGVARPAPRACGLCDEDMGTEAGPVHFACACAEACRADAIPGRAVSEA